MRQQPEHSASKQPRDAKISLMPKGLRDHTPYKERGTGQW